MHIADGILTFPIITVTSALAIGAIGIGLSRVGYERIPQVGILSATFFVASLIHINIGPASAHLMLTGLLGVVLGWTAFPALAAAFLLQALFFGYGGITTLGSNILNSGLSAIICYYIFAPFLRNKETKTNPFLLGIFAGGTGIILNGLFLVVTLFISDSDLLETLLAISAAHIPVLIIEAFVTGAIFSFIKKVKPEIFTSGTGDAHNI